MVVGRGNDAIPTWSGFNYQGKMMLLYVLELINQIEYSCAVTPQVRQTGNRLSGPAGTAYASLLT